MPEVADLFVTLRAITAPFTEALAKSGAEADRFATQLKAMEASATKAGGRLTAMGAEAQKAGTGLKAAGVEAKASAAAMEESAAKTDVLKSKFVGLGPVIDKIAKWGSIGLAGIGIASIDMASKFDAATARLNTQAGVSQDKIAGLKSGVLSLAGQVGFSPDSLAESLFHVESNFESMGISSQKALEYTKVAAEGAAVGGANLVDVTNALTAAVASNIPGVNDLNQAMGVLNTIVGTGDMTMQDLADAMGSGMVATVKGFGLSITDVGAALATFGDNNIRGAVAGTDLRMSVQALAAPVSTASSELHKLGMTQSTLADDMRKGGLKLALEDLSDRFKKAGIDATQQGQVITELFGKKAGAGLQVLMDQMDRLESKYKAQEAGANTFASSWQTAAQTLSQQLKGIEYGFEALGIRIGEVLIPYVSKAITNVEAIGRRGVKDLTDLWTIYGPAVEAKLNDAGAKISKALAAMQKPAEAALKALAVTAIPLLVTSVKTLGDAFGRAETAAGPLLSKLKDLTDSLTSNSGALGTLTGRLQTGIGMLGDISHAIGPLAGAVGDLAHAFADLPGPIQLSVLSMLAMRPFQPQIQAMKDSVTSFGKAGIDAFRGIGDASLYQRVLAAGAGQELGRFGGYVAALESRIPVVASMGEAFRGVYETLPAAASGVDRLGGALRGIGSAAAVGALSGLKSAASGLLDVMGGPWGLAIGAATTLVDYFAQKDAAAKQAVADFTNALQKDSGALGENTRALVAQKLEQSGALDTARKYGIQLSTVTDAVLGNKAAQDQINTVLQQVATHQDVVSKAQQDAGKATTQLNTDAQKLKDTVDGQSGSLSKASQAWKNQQDAMKGAGDAATNATSPTSQLQQAIKTLGDSASTADQKARALHDALTMLSGGQLDVQAATAQANEAVINLNHAWQDGIDQSKGFGAQLLKADGSLNTATENGQALFTKMQDLSEQTATATQATYDYARANGVGVPDALKQAEGAMQSSRDALIQTAEKFGLTTDQAQHLADQMGLIPSELPITLGLKDLDPTEAGLRYVQGQADKLTKGTTVPVSALTDQAIKDLQSVGYTVKNLDGKNLQITADTGSANDNLNSLIDQLGQVHSKHVTVTADYYINQYGKALPMPQANGGLVQFARGGITAFASGGESHIAQIAPAGAMRLWAEPETGGEAYIPLSPSKRARSRMVAEQAVDALGGRIAWNGPGGGAAPVAVGRPGPLTASTGSGGPTTVVVNNYFQIEGSLLAQNDLRDLVQEQMLRLGMNNSQTWQSFARR